MKKKKSATANRTRAFSLQISLPFFFFSAMELLVLFIVKKRRTVAKKIPVVNSLLNEDEGSSEKKKLAVFNRSRLSTNLLSTNRREYEMTVIWRR